MLRRKSDAHTTTFFDEIEERKSRGVTDESPRGLNASCIMKVSSLSTPKILTRRSHPDGYGSGYRRALREMRWSTIMRLLT